MQRRALVVDYRFFVFFRVVEKPPPPRPPPSPPFSAMRFESELPRVPAVPPRPAADRTFIYDERRSLGPKDARRGARPVEINQCRVHPTMILH